MKASSEKPPKLSDAQRRLLIRAVERRDGTNLSGRGEHASFYPLAAAGLVNPIERAHGIARIDPTSAGRALVESWRCANCGHLAYHCIVSGCNHVEDDGDYCDCEALVSKSSAATRGING